MTTRDEEAKAAARELWREYQPLGAAGVACFDDHAAPYLVVYFPAGKIAPGWTLTPGWSGPRTHRGFPVYSRAEGTIPGPRPAG